MIFNWNLTFSIQRKSLFINIYNSLTIHAMVFQSCKGHIPDSPIKASFKLEIFLLKSYLTGSRLLENPRLQHWRPGLHFGPDGTWCTEGEQRRGFVWVNSVEKCLPQVIPLQARLSSSCLTQGPLCVWQRWIPGSTLLSTVELSPVLLSGYTRRTSNNLIKSAFLTQTFRFLESIVS